MWSHQLIVFCKIFFEDDGLQNFWESALENNPKYGKRYMMKILIAIWFVVAKYFTQISTDGRMLKEIQFSSVAQLCLTLCDPMNCSMPGLPVHHQLPEFTQTHVPRVSDAIQPSHPLLFPSSPALSLSQHQGLFQWVGSSDQVAKCWYFSFSISPWNEYSGLISFRIDWFDLLLSKGLSGVREVPSIPSFLWNLLYWWFVINMCWTLSFYWHYPYKKRY